MTIINPNSIAGITSVTAQADVINFFRSNGALAGLQLNGVNFNTTNGISTFNNLTVGGTLTYEDVKNVDSVGIISARTAIHVGAGISAVGIITATSFRGDGSQLTGISSPVTVDSYHNVFGGTDAGASLNSSSNNNVLFGQDAGDSINSGYENVCIGYRAGQALTSSRRNVCLGSDAGKDFTAGDSVFIGWTAGEDASANGNTAVGHNAGGNSRDNDTSFGYNAGPNTSYSGGNNVCVGKSAGNGLRSSAGKNTYIGPNCVGDTANGSYNIALGYEAELSQASISNECVIGDDAGNDGQITRFAVRGAKFVANTSGVGIGTTNPTSDGGTTLEVYNATNPTIRLNDGGQYKGLFQLRGNDLEIRGSNGNVEFFTGNADGASSTEKVRIDSSGRVLIGTTTEGYVSADNLTVADAANAGITIRSGTGNLGTLAFSDGTSGADEYDGYIQYSQSARYMDFGGGGGNIRLRIDSSGRVLIGTTTAAHWDNRTMSIYRNGDNFLELRGNSSNGCGVIFSDGTGNSTAGYPGYIFYAHSDDSMRFHVGGSGDEKLRIHSGGQLTLGTNTSNTSDRFTIVDPGSAFMSIRSDQHSDGNSQVLDFGVGISNRSSGNLTASIEADIHSTSGGTLKSDLKFFTNAGDNLGEKLRITSDGKVSIGFNAPSVHGLSLGYSTTSRGFEFDTGSGFGSSSTIRAYYRPGTSYNTLGLTGSTILFGINDVEKARLDSNGNLGINCTSPTNLSGHKGITLKGTNQNAGHISFLDSADNSDGRILATDGELHIHADPSDNTGSSEVVFFVDNNREMSIDDGGRVLKPNNPRFCIIGGNNLYNNTESNVWDSNAYAPQSSVNGGNCVHVNVGSHYTVSNGRWTVPVAGTYYIFFYGSTGTNHSHFVFIEKNGSQIASDLGLEYSQGEVHQNFGGSIMTTCSANDYFNFRRRGSGYRFYSLVWGGWLIG